jgi:hypothetical protein
MSGSKCWQLNYHSPTSICCISSRVQSVSVVGLAVLSCERLHFGSGHCLHTHSTSVRLAAV